MGGQLIEGKDVSRSQVFHINPHRALIAGVDFGKEDPLYEDTFDPRAHLPLDPEMQASIKMFGVREPVEVLVDDNDRIIVTGGRQRTRNSRVAWDELIAEGQPGKLLPVIGARLTKDRLRLSALTNEVMNNHRMDDSVVMKAEKAIRMLSRGYTREQVAVAFKVKPTTVDDWEKIVGLSEPVRKAIDAGQVSPTAAAKLAGLTKDQQSGALQSMLSESGGKKVTVRAASSVARSAKNGTPDAIVAPSKRQLRKAIENGSSILPPDVITAFRIVLGDLPPSKVKGLTALLRGDDGAAE